MARKRKPRRRMVYLKTFGFHDGSVIACGPDRKPSAKAIQEGGIHICPDGVFHEFMYSPTDWHGWKAEQREKVVSILANRMNTRRAIREIVLPELEKIQSALAGIQGRLDRIERLLIERPRT